VTAKGHPIKRERKKAAEIDSNGGKSEGAATGKSRIVYSDALKDSAQNFRRELDPALSVR